MFSIKRKKNPLSRMISFLDKINVSVNQGNPEIQLRFS